jgi:hypothetical protein
MTIRSGTDGSAVCTSNLLNITDTMHSQSLRKIVLRPGKNVVGICKQITILILHEVASMLVATIKLIYSSIQVTDVLVLTVRCKLINFAFQIFPLFIPGFASYIVQIIPIYFTRIL